MVSPRNKVQLIGNLGRDPETKIISDKQRVTNFPLATNEPYKDKDGNSKKHTEWHNIICWGKVSEIADKYLQKGSEVLIEGKLKTRNWQDKDGNTKYITEIVTEAIVMMSRAESNKNQSEPASAGSTTEQSDDDDNLPF